MIIRSALTLRGDAVTAVDVLIGGIGRSTTAWSQTDRLDRKPGMHTVTVVFDEPAGANDTRGSAPEVDGQIEAAAGGVSLRHVEQSPD